MKTTIAKQVAILRDALEEIRTWNGESSFRTIAAGALSSTAPLCIKEQP